ncbi:hypothetical protein DSECCO2_119870 [anaerobic digester metagenome]
MGHNLNFKAGKASFFTLKEKAWHGLGTIVEEAKTAEEVMKIANLDFEVVKRQSHITGEGYELLDLPGTFGTLRTDTNEVLGTVGSDYKVVQNIEAFNFINNIIAKGDAIFETAGVLGKGEKIFVTAKLPDYIRIEGTDDVIEKYILFTNGHTGKDAVIATLTPIRVVCNNTLNMALQTCSNTMRFKHSGNVQDKLKQGLELMGLARKYVNQLDNELNYMRKLAVTAMQVADTINKVVFNEADLIKFKYGNTDEISSRKLNLIEDLNVYIEQGVGQDLHRGTALWLYNGISSFYNNGVDYKTQADKFNSLTSGANYNKLQKAFDLINEL